VRDALGRVVQSVDPRGTEEHETGDPLHALVVLAGGSSSSPQGPTGSGGNNGSGSAAASGSGGQIGSGGASTTGGAGASGTAGAKAHAFVLLDQSNMAGYPKTETMVHFDHDSQVTLGMRYEAKFVEVAGL
jgi:hypothetical protein